jgi:hypothetical protein
VTTCNRCGGVLLANATVCRYCGAPVLPGAAGGSNPLGSMGARQRSQERWGSGSLPPPDPFAAFPPSSSAGAPFPSQSPRMPTPDESGVANQWRAPSLLDPSQLPEWLQPNPPARRAPSGGVSKLPEFPGSESLPTARPGFNGPSQGPASSMPPAPMRQQPPSANTRSPYFDSGRRATDDLFANSSLIDQKRLPDWLARDPQGRGGAPNAPKRNAGNNPSAQPGMNDVAPHMGAGEQQLPDWLRAMDPGAPPSFSRLTSGPLRQSSGGSNSLDPQRVNRQGQPNMGTPGADPFSTSQVGLPPLEWFGNPLPESVQTSHPMPNHPANAPAQRPGMNFSGPTSGGRPGTGNPNPFASRSPFEEQQGPGASRFGAPGGQGFLPTGPQRMGAGSTGASPFESRPADLFNQPAAPYSANTPITDNSLPAWLFAGNNDAGTTGRSPGPSIQRPPDARPALDRTLGPGHSSPSNAGQTPFSQPAGRNNDLPTWEPFPERPGSSTSQKPMQPEADPFSSPPSATTTPFDSASLVDEHSLPDWLRSSNETEPLPLPFTVSDSIGGPGRPRNERGKEQTSAQPGKTGGSNEEEALPDWLRQVYAEAHVPALQEPGQPKPSIGGKALISGSDLLDERSVPKWLQEASQTSPLPDFPKELLWTTPIPSPSKGTAQPTGPETPPPTGASGPLGFAGQSLIDESSLPEWLRNMDPGSPPKIGASRKSTTGPTQPASQPSGSASGIFSAAELIDTQSLPTWMKADAAPTAGAGSSAGLSSKAAEPTPQSGPTGGASGIFSAAELVDTQSLPTWLKKEEEAAAPPKQNQPASGSGPAGSASGVFSAAELVDTQSLPAWLRTEGSEAAPGQERQPDGASGPAGSASGVFSAAELVDTQSLPAWLKAEDQTPPPTTSSTIQGNGDWKGNSSKIAAIPTGFSPQKSGVFSAADLVDGESLPAWLKGAVADPSASQAGQSNAAQQPTGQMSAAELVDTQSLPAWMRETGQGPAISGVSGSTANPRSGALRPSTEPANVASSQTGGFSAASLVDPEALPEWLRAAQGSEAHGPSQQGSGQLTGQSWDQSMSSPEGEQGGLSGASLIDPAQLPDWMRNPTSLQRDNGQEGGPHARVPRRPHLSNEPNRAPSQAAADVFSSVLGPTAGEEAKGKRPNKRKAAQQEAADEWSSAPARQSGEWGSNEPGQSRPPAAQRNSGQVKPQYSGFEGQQGAAGSSPDWQQVNAGMPPSQGQPQDARRMGARPTGSKPPTQPTWQGEQTGEWGDIQSPANPQAGRGMPNAFGPDGSAPADFYGAGPAGAYGPGPQGRGMEQGGWENIPPGYDQGFSYDDDVGPPSGIFAKVKRMLGFGR